MVMLPPMYSTFSKPPKPFWWSLPVSVRLPPTWRIGGQVPEEARIELDAVVREGQIAADLRQRSEGHLLHTAVTHRQVAVDFRNLRESVATPQWIR